MDNASREQLFARVRRYKSHAGMNPSERKVVVYEWIACLPRSFYEIRDIARNNWIKRMRKSKYKSYHFESVQFSDFSPDLYIDKMNRENIKNMKAVGLQSDVVEWKLKQTCCIYDGASVCPSEPGDLRRCDHLSLLIV